MSDSEEYYQKQARAYFDLSTDMRQKCFDAQMQWGRWVLNSLLLMHSGSILAITQVEGKAATLLQAAGIWFVCGIVAVLIAGTCAWINWSANFAVYNLRADPGVLVSRDRWIEEDGKYDGVIDSTLFLSIAFGALSVFCLLVGAVEAYRALSL